MKKWLLGLFVLVLVFGMVGCGGGGGGTVVVWNSNIYIENNSGWDLDIWMDGVHYLTLWNGNWDWITNVPPGGHIIEAWEYWGGWFYDSRVINTVDFVDYQWIIW